MPTAFGTVDRNLNSVLCIYAWRKYFGVSSIEATQELDIQVALATFECFHVLTKDQTDFPWLYTILKTKPLKWKMGTGLWQ